MDRARTCIELCVDVDGVTGGASSTSRRSRSPFGSDLVRGALVLGPDDAHLVLDAPGVGAGLWDRLLDTMSSAACRCYEPSVERFGHHYRGTVHRGFGRALDSVWGEIESRLDAVVGDLPVTVTGHGFGGALATLAAARYRDRTGRELATCTFGAPKVGDGVFAASHPGQWRFEHGSDLVPFLAPAPGVRELLADVPLLDRLVPSTEVAYEHAGRLVFMDWSGGFVDLAADPDPAVMETVLRLSRWGDLTLRILEFADHLFDGAPGASPLAVDHRLDAYRLAVAALAADDVSIFDHRA
ncbi:MAG: hypothetical protein S0880_36375 [Actinomycetota bacterium]|nr:hypothetical protein [Actinomycetota bacterium]